MSVNDITTLGHAIGFDPSLDTPKAAKWHCTYNANNGDSGNGLCNGRVFANDSDKKTALQVHNKTTGNAAAEYKVGRCVDATCNIILCSWRCSYYAVGGADCANHKFNTCKQYLSNNCPLMINHHASGTVGQGIVPTSVDQIVAGVVSKAPVT
jgi:hypothetical protein